jgi:DNA-binding response OmpR family regulator
MNEIAVKPKKILVVDDDPNVLFLISELLARDNYEVIQASDGLTALAQIRQMPPELAVLDVMMPGLDGFELCRRIKNDPLTTGIKVIMVTAKTSGKDIETGLSAGADHYLTKPFKIAELSQKIKDLIG